MQIESFEQACTVLALDPENLPVVDMLSEKHQKSVTAYAKLIIIAQAMNEGWEPNWNDDDQPKYFPWFEVKASEEQTSGFGFSFTFYDRWDTITVVGSRLSFKTRELALYAGKQFADLYKEYLLIG